MRRIALALVVVSGVTLGVAGPAWAETMVVSQTADTPPANPVGSCLSGLSCSLREAVTDANDNTESPGADTIQLPAGTYTLTNDALPQIPGDVTIEGVDGATVTTITGADTTASSTPQGGVFTLNGGAAKLTLRGVSVKGNRLTGTAAIGGGALAAGSGATVVIERSILRGNRTEAASNVDGGGAIAGIGITLTVTDSAIEDNVYAGTQPPGGGDTGAAGIAVDNSTTEIVRSSVSRNRGDLFNAPNVAVVGGLYANTGGSLVITDSTVSGNSVTSGGASFRSGGIIVNGSFAPVTLTNLTLTDNVTSGAGAQVHGNLTSFTAPTATIRNSIVAGGAPDNCHTLNSTIVSSGGNVEDANSCSFTGPGDLVNRAPKLAALQFTGGLGLSQEP